MKKFASDKSSSNFWVNVAVSVLVGFAVMFLMIIIFAIIMSAAEMSSSSAKIISPIALGVGAFVCGIVSSKRQTERLIVSAALSGLVMYILVAVVSALISKSGFTSALIIRMAVTVVASVAGTLLIALSVRKNKYI